MRRYTVVALTVGAALAVASASTTLGSAARSAQGAPSTPFSGPSAAQALRTCVDRWNQDNMLGWGPTLVSISVRRLRAREADHVGIYDHRPHCTASLAGFAPRDSQTGCPGGAVMAGHPKICVFKQTTSVCVSNRLGGYECSRYTDGTPPLRNKNARTNERGVLTLDVALAGTHATPPLAWQRRYPHIDGFIHPWTRKGQLRLGLTFDQAGGKRHYHGTCFAGTEFTHDTAALRCVSDVQFDPCFPATATWNRRGAIIACAAAGSTSFGRFVITRRS
jgi:hypothetical protein